MAPENSLLSQQKETCFFPTRHFQVLFLAVSFREGNWTNPSGGFKYVLFSSLLAEMIQFDEHIFQMGWFNHQQANYLNKCDDTWVYKKRAPWLFEEKKGMKSYPVMSYNPGL